MDMIEPIAYRKKLEGKSNAHLITFNDGRDYVVKYFQPGFEKTLANEWISYCLARYLGLPIPFAQFVEIPHDFSSQIPELARVERDSISICIVIYPRLFRWSSGFSYFSNHESSVTSKYYRF